MSDAARDSSEALARAVGEAIGDAGATPGQSQIRRLTSLARASAKAAGGRAVTSGRWVAGVSLDLAGHLPVRDLVTLREHHDGLSGAYLARNLIRSASLASGAVGATTGAVAASTELHPGTWVAIPAELMIETLVVVGVEMKLTAELHEAAGYPVTYDLRRSGPLIAGAWAETRGIEPSDLARLATPGRSAAFTQTASELLGRSARDQLIEQIRKRLIRRAGRNSVTFIPMMVGAVAGGELNRRATRRFGALGGPDARHPAPVTGLPPGPVEPPPSRWRFASPLDADPDGPVAIGADLQPATLLAAYRAGVFPMPVHRGRTLAWWSPDPRGVIPLDGLRVSRSLAKAVRRHRITIDAAFDVVLAGCADPRRPGGWITSGIRRAYTALHELGWAHSVEAWTEDGRLAGGLYGVAIGGLFAGESMFHREVDGSKVALVGLVEHLTAGGATLLDVQWTTPHLVSLGAVDVPRDRYLEQLADAVARPGPRWT